MALNIKHSDLPFVVIGDKIRRPNGQEEPLRGDNLALVQVFLLNQLLIETQKANEVKETEAFKQTPPVPPSTPTPKTK
jgi:hypothetical protein